MVNTIYVVRHGLRADDKPSPTHIEGDPALSEGGAEQAAEAGAFFASQLDPKTVTVFASPFYRCCQTATAISHALGDLPIYVESGIGESYSKPRPKKPQPAPLSEVMKFFPLIDPKYKQKVSVDVTGETRVELRDRLFKAIEHVLQVCTTDNVIIVTHAAGKIELGAVLTGTPTDPAATCSIDKYVLNNGLYECTLNNDVSHLKHGAQNVWTFREPAPTADGVTELVQFDFGSLGPQFSNCSPADITVANLGTDKPLVQIKDKLFEGRWQRVVGTELFCNNRGQPEGTSTQRIKLFPAEIDTDTNLRKLFK